jgi:hypothetical protein
VVRESLEVDEVGFPSCVRSRIRRVNNANGRLRPRRGHGVLLAVSFAVAAASSFAALALPYLVLRGLKFDVDVSTITSNIVRVGAFSKLGYKYPRIIWSGGLHRAASGARGRRWRRWRCLSKIRGRRWRRPRDCRPRQPAAGAPPVSADLHNGREGQSGPADRGAGADAGGGVWCMRGVEDVCLKLLHAGRRTYGRVGRENDLE